LIEGDDTKKSSEPSHWRSFGLWDRLLKVDHGTRIETSRGVFASWNIWGCGFGYMLMTGVVNVLLAWLPKYLGEVKNFPLLQVGVIASLPFIGGVLGNVLGGWLSDNLLGKRRKPTMMISAVATCVMMLAMIYAPGSALVVSLLLFLAGFLLNVGYSSFSVYSMGLTTPKTYPVAASLVNSTGQVGGALAPLIAGILLDSYDWNMVFVFLAACSIGALLFIVMMVEPMPQEQAA
jgi:sugar phosphate permease